MVLFLSILFIFFGCSKKKVEKKVSEPLSFQEEKVPSEILQKEKEILEAEQKRLPSRTSFKTPPFYLKIEEINRDDIEIAIDADLHASEALFFKRGASVVIQQEVFEKLKKEEKLSPQLVCHYTPCDLSQALLLIEYWIRYEGKCRNKSFLNMHVFNVIPAQLEFKQTLAPSILLDVGSEQGEEALFSYRLTPPLIQFKLKENELFVETQGQSYKGGEGDQPKTIFETSSSITVFQQVLDSIPLSSELKEENIKFKKQSLGSKTFKTKIQMEYLGTVHDLQIEK